jgi:hypothetical protein
MGRSVSILGIAKDIVGGIISPVGDIIDNLHTSEEEKSEAKAKLAEIENALSVKILEYESRLAEAQASTIVAEATGESWMQRNWRPVTMLSFVTIIVNNYILVPYAEAFGAAIPALDIPNGMWALLNVGIGGYIASRGVEKVFKMRNGNG